jgi:hypothetical protein
VLALCCGDGGGGILFAEGFGDGSAAFCFKDLGVEATAEEDEKAEVVAQKGVAFAAPCVGGLAGRVVEPVAGEGEVLA